MAGSLNGIPQIADATASAVLTGFESALVAAPPALAGRMRALRDQYDTVLTQMQAAQAQAQALVQGQAALQREDQAAAAALHRYAPAPAALDAAALRAWASDVREIMAALDDAASRAESLAGDVERAAQ